MVRASAVVVAAAVLASRADAFNVSYGEPVLLGQSKGGQTHFWMPSDGVRFDNGQAALRVRLRGFGCTCDDGDVLASVGEPCAKPCDPSHRWYLTADGGETFTEQTDAAGFCGHRALAVKAEGKTVLRCPETDKVVIGEGSVKFPQVDWEVSGNTLSAKPAAEMTMWTHSLRRSSPPAAVLLGSNIVEMEERKLLFRAMSLRWDEAADADQEVTAIFKSQDNGTTWIHVNNTVAPLAASNMLTRHGEKGLQLYTGIEDRFISVKSTNLGKRWGTPVPMNLTRLPSSATTHFTKLMAGMSRGSPQLYFLYGKKSSNYSDLSLKHDLSAAPEDRYGSEHIDAAKQGIFDGCDRAPFPDAPEKGCMSTGAVQVMMLGVEEDNQNNTAFLACYDKLGAGWGGPRDGAEDQVWCQRVVLDETKENIAYLKKLKREEEKRKAEEEARKRAEEAREERRKRDQEKRRARNRAEKERKKLYAKLDWELSIRPALRYQEFDGEMVIVREVLSEWEDIVHDSIGMPGPDFKPPVDEEEPASKDDAKVE